MLCVIHETRGGGGGGNGTIFIFIVGVLGERGPDSGGGGK